MILFCDTSARLKLYITEAGAAQVAQVFATCELLAVARIAWVEAHAALARRAREQPADQTAIDTARQRLAQHWPDFLTLELTPELAARAAEFADVFALRAYDSVQLASAHVLHQAQQEQIMFGCFDRRLNRAAATLGLATLE